MRHCIVEDSSFIIALMDKGDLFHKDAVFIFAKLEEFKDRIKFIIPPLALYEVITTLKRKGSRASTIEERILKLIHIDNILLASLSEMTAFRHAKRLLKESNQAEALRTHDFLIVSTGLDYEAQILTFDESMRTKVGEVYEEIYYCSNHSEQLKNETHLFIGDLRDKFC